MMKSLFRSKAKAKPTIIAFGDSLTEGYYMQGRNFHPYTIKLQELLSSMKGKASNEIMNCGISGETTDEMRPRLKSLLLQEYVSECKAVIILGGTNDLGSQNVENIVNNVTWMHDLVLSHKLQSFAVTVPETYAEKIAPIYATVRKSVNSRLSTFCAERSIPIIDLAEFIPYDAKDGATKLWDDNLHFSPAGYDKFGKLVFESVKGYL